MLNNLGTISGTNRAIYTSGSTSGSFTVHNEAGATITAVKDAIKIANLGSANGTFTIDNKGTISSTGIADERGRRSIWTTSRLPTSRPSSPMRRAA